MISFIIMTIAQNGWKKIFQKIKQGWNKALDEYEKDSWWDSYPKSQQDGITILNNWLSGLNLSDLTAKTI